MKNYIFCDQNDKYSPAVLNSFYRVADKADYEKAGTWPDNFVEVTEEEFAEFTGTAPAGKILGSVDGHPAWVDITKTPEEQAAENLATAQNEYVQATKVITSLNEQIEDADYDGTTEAAVKAELAAWTNYRKELRAYLKAADGSQSLPSAPQD